VRKLTVSGSELWSTIYGLKYIWLATLYIHTLHLNVNFHPSSIVHHAWKFNVASPANCEDKSHNALIYYTSKLKKYHSACNITQMI